jgi:hypothetical protein
MDAAIDAVQQSIIERAVAKKLNELGEEPILSEMFWQCEDLTAKNHLEVVRTNRALAKKYSVALRTITNWRKEGCPFKDGQWAVLDWLAERRYAPAGARAKFAKQLNERKDKAKWAQMNGELHALTTEARQLKAAHQDNGLKVPDWLRGFRAKR